MGRKAADRRGGVERERARREAARRVAERRAALPADDEPAAFAGVRDMPVSGSRRMPGAKVLCGWCGDAVVVKRTGPTPRWCSATCRHRAWEQRRAAVSGRAAVEVLDRVVPAAPASAAEWAAYLTVLAQQLAAASREISDADLPDLADRLGLVNRALRARRSRTHI